MVESRFALQTRRSCTPTSRPTWSSPTSTTRTPLLHGQVLTVSADKLDDTRNGASYLRVRVALPPAERARAWRAWAAAGLPVDVW